MRLSQDNHSWKARAILRRDFRHAPLLDEKVRKGKTKKSKKYVRSDHKHIYVKSLRKFIYSWSQTTFYYVQHICAQCQKVRRKTRHASWRPVKVKRNSL